MSRPYRTSTEEIEIIYADEFIVVVNKPALLLSVPGRGEEKQDCLISRLATQFSDILTVHRLDWETSGLTVLALDKTVHRDLSRQFQEHQVHKNYTAIVYGKPDKESGEINLPLRCDWENRPRQIVDHEQGKASQTYWQHIKQADSLEQELTEKKHSTRLLLTPVTGRSHQLRVHMLALGHPILGDHLYAHPDAVSMAERLLLHATQLEFTHPNTNKRVKFYSRPPF